MSDAARAGILTHYTGRGQSYTESARAVANMLTHGFAFMPNPRQVTQWLLPEHDFGNEEPQQFGMISFTDLPIDAASEVRRCFGQFGVSVTSAWALRNGAQPLLYVTKGGPVADALRALFHAAHGGMKAAIPYPKDTFWTRSYRNRFVAAAFGGREYALLLRMYDFMESAEHAWQREW
jgi:hypothetical protein